jgi:hypothetical protein
VYFVRDRKLSVSLCVFVRRFQPHHKKALILGTGGASKESALDELNIPILLFREAKKMELTMTNQCNHIVVQIIINTPGRNKSLSMRFH